MISFSWEANLSVCALWHQAWEQHSAGACTFELTTQTLADAETYVLPSLWLHTQERLIWSLQERTKRHLCNRQS